MDSYQLKWHSHSNHLNGSVAALLRSERFTDVVLCTLDGCQIPAHKFILNSCSIYLSNLFESQRSSLRLGNSMIYVILPAEVTTKALQILIEYMYKGETTVSNDVLDIVLKAGDLLKVRGLWRQSEDKNEKPADKIVNERSIEIVNKPQQIANKLDDLQKPKISVKKDDKLLKTYSSLQHINISRQSFISPPKLVFIKTSDATTPLRSIAPRPPSQTIIVKPDIPFITENQELKDIPANPTNSEPKIVLKKIDKKYAKRPKHDLTKNKKQKEFIDNGKLNVKETLADISDAFKEDIEEKSLCDIIIKPEPNWENDDPLDQEMFHSEITIKPELDDTAEEMDEEGEQIYSPLTCELCFEVFHIPAEWVRHIQTHTESNPQARKRKARSASDDTEEATALLRCDLCQKLFPNPAEWVRHIQNTHTETELALSNNSSPPRRHNRYVYGDQKKTCDHCKKIFPSHASMVIHLRTHTGERPFVCGLCNKGFNVKSNLLRHLRTLHDTIVSPGNVPLLQEDVLLTPSPDTILSSTPAEKNVKEPS